MRRLLRSVQARHELLLLCLLLLLLLVLVEIKELGHVAGVHMTEAVRCRTGLLLSWMMLVGLWRVLWMVQRQLLLLVLLHHLCESIVGRGEEVVREVGWKETRKQLKSNSMVHLWMTYIATRWSGACRDCWSGCAFADVAGVAYPVDLPFRVDSVVDVAAVVACFSTMHISRLPSYLHTKNTI